MRKIVLFSLVLLLNIPLAHAQWVPFVFLNNTGGLNDGSNPTAIKDNQSPDLQNAIFTIGGEISKRQGFSNINSSAISATAVFTGITFYKLSDGSRFLVANVADTGNDKYYKMDYAGGTGGPDGTWDDITGSLTPSFGANDGSDYATALDVLVIEDGIDSTPPDQWTGTGDAIDLSNAPNSRYVEYHKNHLFTAGNDTNASQVAFSSICTTSSNCLESWTVTDVFNVETNDGQVVTGLKSGLDALYIWKQESIWRLSGNSRDRFVLEQMVIDIGTCSNSSIAVINNKFIFTTCQGDIAVYDGGLNVQFISTNIDQSITNLNQDRFDKSIAVAFDEDYYLSTSAAGAGTHNRIFIFNTQFQAWTKFIGIDANAMTVYETGTLEHALAFGNYTGTANTYPDTNADDGSAISFKYCTKQYNFPDIPQQKTWRTIETFINQEGDYNLTLERRVDFASVGSSVSIDLSGAGSLWDTAIYDVDDYADLTTFIDRQEVNQTGRFFQACYSNENANEPVTIVGFTFWVQPDERL